MSTPTQPARSLSASWIAESADRARRIPASGPTTTTRAPYDEQPIATLPTSEPTDVRAAYAQARRAQRRWAATGWTERRRVLSRLHDLVFDRQRAILDLIQLESGKARKHAFEEVADVALAARWLANAGGSLLRPHRRNGLFPVLTQVREYRHPKGVVGVISPWNYPFTIAASDALAALAAGNGVVHKPDTQTALTALYAVELAEEAGLPEGLWQLVLGSGATTGGAVVDEADYVCFTGSTAVGRDIARRCGDRLIGCTLELGGKNGLIVCADAQLDRAAETAARACFSNAGQLCISIERLYVADAVYSAFQDRFLRHVEALSLGATYDFGPDMGSLISAAQRQRVADHVDDAVAQGATVLAGGKTRADLGPFFYEPTVLADVTPQMHCYGTETFGPVVALHRVSDEDAAVAAHNDSPYGLNAAVFTRDVARGRAIANRLKAGTVNINEGYSPTWGSHDAPMGGMGDSGLGRRHGAEGLLKYTEPQTVASQRLLGVRPPEAMSYDTYARLMTDTLRLLKKVGRR